MIGEETILKVFKETGALWEGHFRLTSGKHSSRYIQCARVLQYPEKAAFLAGELVEKIGPPARGVTAVVGPATGGIIVAHELARVLHCRAIFSERESGGMTLRRGFEVEEGERVLVVEDVVTTGGSLDETARLLQTLGAQVTACAALVDRSGGKVKFIAPFSSLLNLEIPVYEPETCPLCAQGLPVVKPGSRQLK